MNQFSLQESLLAILVVAVTALGLVILCFTVKNFAWDLIPFLPALIVAAVFSIHLRSAGIFAIVVCFSFLLPWKFDLFSRASLGFSNNNHYENYIVQQCIDSWAGLLVGAIPAGFWYAWQNSPNRMR